MSLSTCSGVLKDYLRELPYPLITKHLYEAVLESMATRPLRIGAGACENDQADSEHTVRLLDNLPDVERVSETNSASLSWHSQWCRYLVTHGVVKGDGAWGGGY